MTPRPHALMAVLMLGSALAACSGNHQSGSAQQTQGHIEGAAGTLTGNDHLKREGRKDEVVGDVKGAAHSVGNAARDATH